MRRVILIVVLVAVLLSTTLTVALAGAGWEDPHAPGAEHANGNGAVNTNCVRVPANAASHAGFIPDDNCPAP